MGGLPRGTSKCSAKVESCLGSQRHPSMRCALPQDPVGFGLSCQRGISAITGGRALLIDEMYSHRTYVGHT